MAAGGLATVSALFQKNDRHHLVAGYSIDIKILLLFTGRLVQLFYLILPAGSQRLYITHRVLGQEVAILWRRQGVSNRKFALAQARELPISSLGNSHQIF